MKVKTSHKIPHVLIVDASKGRFRVHSVASNGEKLSSSEVLNSVANVVKNIAAHKLVWETSEDFSVVYVHDATKKQIFFTKKIATSGVNKTAGK